MKDKSFYINKFGIYVHIPFCKQACHYCNFHFSTNLKLKDNVLAAILKEIDLQKSYIGGASVSSIYFGGGTPSILKSEDIENLLVYIKKSFVVENDIEVTLEVNPDDVSIEKLTELKNIGINRLSIGIQTFQDDALKYLNRVHSSSCAIESIKIARKVGFDNLSVDLIYAIPIVNVSELQKDLNILLDLSPEHISAYCLTIEKETVFGKWLERGKIQEVPEDAVVEQYEMVVGFLEEYGYIHYEVSNFAKLGKYAVHNTNYWKQDCGYLGLGPGAHSFNGETRQCNVSNNYTYITSLAEDKVPFTLEILTQEDKINEYMMTSLRTKSGCDMNYLLNFHNYDLRENSSSIMSKLESNRLCSILDNKIILTSKGLLLADGIAKSLFITKNKF